ncbi:MAG TPA: hypothetical protein VFM34_05115 [Moraxellaceae bacterium]|nr:hypothetical protein [Moraxellaceae bacterium]
MAKRDTETLRYLLDYCEGDRQREKVAAYIECGSHAKAASLLDCHPRNVQRAVQHAKHRAAMQGHSPEHGMVHTVPDGFNVRGVSTLYDAKGKAVSQWVKSGADDARRREIMKGIFDAFADDLPRVPPSKPITVDAPDLLNLYTFTDGHVGAYAWAAEGGAEWNLDIAEQTFVDAGNYLMKVAPKAKKCILSFQGDWLHFDGMLPVTPTHGHVLDAAGRPGQVVTYAIRICRRLIAAALKRHEQVDVVVSEGNHDLYSSLWLRRLLTVAYENEQRVNVHQHESPYHATTHGLCFIGWHHGHLKKNEQLPLLFATRFPEMWGRTRYRDAHGGHWHHERVNEHSGMTYWQHGALPAPDSHASRNGYDSHRQATAITYSAKCGRIAVNIYRPEMSEAA